MATSMLEKQTTSRVTLPPRKTIMHSHCPEKFKLHAAPVKQRMGLACLHSGNIVVNPAADSKNGVQNASSSTETGLGRLKGVLSWRLLILQCPAFYRARAQRRKLSLQSSDPCRMLATPSFPSQMPATRDLPELCRAHLQISFASQYSESENGMGRHENAHVLIFE